MDESGWHVIRSAAPRAGEYRMPSVYIPKPKTKIMPCRHCNCDVEVGWKRKRLPICDVCSVAAVDEAIRQMRAKSGPYYDRWLARMQETYRDKITATPTPVNNNLRSS